MVSKCSHADLGPQKLNLPVWSTLKTTLYEAMGGFLCISTSCVLFHMSDEIIFQKSWIKLVLMFKGMKSVHFSTHVKHSSGLLFIFYCVCVYVCASVKASVLCSLACVCAQLTQDHVRASATGIFSFASGQCFLPRYCKSRSWGGVG